MRSNKVLNEDFDMARIEGKTLAEVETMNLEWESAYPTVEKRDGALIVTGIVDGNYPESFNGGNWEIIGDNYAIATDEN